MIFRKQSPQVMEITNKQFQLLMLLVFAMISLSWVPAEFLFSFPLVMAVFQEVCNSLFSSNRSNSFLPVAHYRPIWCLCQQWRFRTEEIYPNFSCSMSICYFSGWNYLIPRKGRFIFHWRLFRLLCPTGLSTISRIRLFLPTWFYLFWSLQHHWKRIPWCCCPRFKLSSGYLWIHSTSFWNICFQPCVCWCHFQSERLFAIPG